MRYRFSLRLVLLFVVLTAACLYVLFQRPTVIANRFIEALQNGDYNTAKVLFAKLHSKSVADSPLEHVFDRAFAELLPRESSDVWGFRRRILLRIAFHDDRGGRHVEWTEDYDVVAHITGLEILQPVLWFY